MTSKEQQLLAKPLDQFTYDELSSLRSYLMGCEVQSRMSLLWDMEADKRALEAAKRYDRFTGTRNDGYRSFVKLQENEQAVVSFVASKGSKGRILLENYSSTNHIDHLIAHYPTQDPFTFVVDDNTVVVSRAKMLEKAQ